MNKYILNLCIAGMCSLWACAPINLFTKIEKTPRTHSYNYCIDELEAPKSIINDNEWIVYSDRDNNKTTMYPGGKVNLKTLNYLEPLLIIGHKGDYFKLINYKPELVNGGSLVKRKDAEYYGWIHKSKLLLNSQSVTDIRTGLKNKSILAIGDTSTVLNANLFFQNDSVKTFTNPNFYDVKGMYSPYEIIYAMKRDTDIKKVLISKTPYVNPDNIQASIIGWVNADLIQSIGQQLFIDQSSYDANITPSLKPISFKYSPLLKKSATNPQVYHTASLMPIIDKSDNCIFNADGNPISFKDKVQIEQELKQINVLFFIQPGQKTWSQLPILINSFQNMKNTFQAIKDGYSFKYATVVANYNNGSLQMDTLNFTDDFNDIISHLINISKAKPLNPVPPNLAWEGLHTCMDLIAEQEPATNLVITFCEYGKPTNWNETQLATKASKNNCRFLSYQLYAGADADYNNFVSQFTDLINTTAKYVSKVKRERIVYASQIRQINKYKETAKNTFYLDFPEQSMTQGGICFAEKNQAIEFEQLNATMDSIVFQIVADNNSLIENLNKAFTTMGNAMDKYEGSFLARYNINKQQKINPNFKEGFKTTVPLLYQDYSATIPKNEKVNYHLLLSAKELESMINLIDGIAALNIDIQTLDKNKKAKANNKNICDCPDSYITQEAKQASDPSKVIIRYISTRKTRNSLKTLLKNELKTTGLRKIKVGKLSVADVNEIIFQAPITNQKLTKFGIRGIPLRKIFQRRDTISDKELEELLAYYKGKKKMLDEEIGKKLSFTSSDEIYYWVSANWLP